MNATQGRKLKVGDKVWWQATAPAVQGVVTELLSQGVIIKWSDGQEGGLDFRDMGQVTT